MLNSNNRSGGGALKKGGRRTVRQLVTTGVKNLQPRLSSKINETWCTEGSIISEYESIAAILIIKMAAVV